MASQNSWGGQFPLGGSAIQIAAAQNADGQLEIFYVGTNSDLYCNTQMEADGLLWGGQAAFPGNSAQQIAAALNQNGVLEIFYVGTNNDLYHNMQTAPGSDTWVGETHFPGDSAKQVAVGTNADGLLEIFYVGTNNDLYHNRQLSPDGAWAGQVSFAGNSARQIAVGQNEDGRLEIFYVGTNNDLYHNWQTQPNGTAWNGETPFQGNSAQQVTVARNEDGRLEIFYVGTNNELYHNWQTAPGSSVWFGETSFQGNSAQQVAVGVNFGGRLEIFYVGTDNTLYHNWQTETDGLAWNGQTAFSGDSAQQVTVAQNQDGRLEIFYVGTNNDIYHQWQTPPAQGFGSNSNYILASNCNPLLGVTVTIDVTQDIIAVANTGPTSGFEFQLNAYSPKNEKCAYQQYSIALFGSEIVGSVDNWPLHGSNIINDFFSMVSLPSAKIPAGYKLTISLQNDAQGNITGATYTVVDDNGKTLANVKKVLTSLTGIGVMQGGNASDLAPIVAFELNLVGPENSEGAVLSSGAGTFTYTATTPLTALVSEPPCAESTDFTRETANSEPGRCLRRPAPPSPSRSASR